MKHNKYYHKYHLKLRQGQKIEVEDIDEDKLCQVQSSIGDSDDYIHEDDDSMLEGRN